MTEIIDSTGEEIGTDVVHVEQPPTALFKTDDPVEVIEKATQVANALKGVLKQQGLTQNIQGKEHVKVEGWQLVGAMLGVTAVCVDTVEVEGGYKATVETRMADGRVIGRADALCTKAESMWKKRDDYARLSMAQTRATSKAFKGPLGFVVSLAGFQSTPAEEMTFAATPEPEVSTEPTIDTERANQIALSIHEAMQKGVDGKRLALMFSAAGASPSKIDRHAVGDLTLSQASLLERSLFEAMA